MPGCCHDDTPEKGEEAAGKPGNPLKQFPEWESDSRSIGTVSLETDGNRNLRATSSGIAAGAQLQRFQFCSQKNAQRQVALSSRKSTVHYTGDVIK
jgi:hypothetical protein